MLNADYLPLQLVFEANGDDLLDVNTLKAMCTFQYDLRSQYLGTPLQSSWLTGNSCHDRDLGYLTSWS